MHQAIQSTKETESKKLGQFDFYKQASLYLASILYIIMIPHLIYNYDSYSTCSYTTTAIYTMHRQQNRGARGLPPDFAVTPVLSQRVNLIDKTRNQALICDLNIYFVFQSIYFLFRNNVNEFTRVYDNLRN